MPGLVSIVQLLHKLLLHLFVVIVNILHGWDCQSHDLQHLASVPPTLHTVQLECQCRELPIHLGGEKAVDIQLIPVDITVGFVRVREGFVKGPTCQPDVAAAAVLSYE